MTTTVFTYGSLMFPRVWQNVVRGSYRASNAHVKEHGRFAVHGEKYPGMVLLPGSSVDGVLYHDLDDADLLRLDRFEGSEYRRDTVIATLEDGQQIEADTYIHIVTERLASTPWHPGEFDLAGFLHTYCPEGSV
ncbi:MAG: gamma-glutamylcyclotransferase family protein [Janthinobacterium lividum]